MNVFLKFALGFLICACSFISNGKVIKPGDTQFNPSVLIPYQTKTSWGSQRFSIGKIGERKVINILNVIDQTPMGMLSDHIIIDADTLALIHRHAPWFAVGNDVLVADVNGVDLSGSLNPFAGGEPIIINTKLDSPVFEESTLPFVLASLPLEKGFKAQLPRLAVSGTTKKFSTGSIDVEVLRKESVKAGSDNKKYDTWVVEAKWSGVDFIETLWVSKKPPYAIQKESTMNGKSRGKSSFESVDYYK